MKIYIFLRILYHKTYTPIIIMPQNKIAIYNLKNNKGVRIDITNFGGKIINIYVPDNKGNLMNINLGYDNLPDTVSGDLYLGALIGRYANRIAKGRFELDKETYILKTNGGAHALHGGEIGYNAVIWKARQENNKLILSHTDKDGTEGYPGTVKVQVVYELNDDNELIIAYQAETDKATPVNFTNHAYFNLNGTDSISLILNHLLKINADNYTPIDNTSIPTGEIVTVENTPFDFRKYKSIGKDIDADHPQIKNGKGYDHNFVLNGANDELKFAAEAISPVTGISLKVFTTEPGMQFYTGNFINIDEFGKKYVPHSGFCLETQHFPDSPNKAEFPNTILPPGEIFKSKTIYRFGLTDFR